MADQSTDKNFTKAEMMSGLISQISSYIEQYHGGSVELVSFEEDEVKVRLGGACIGCPLSAATLQGWVQGTITQFFPGIIVTGVE